MGKEVDLKKGELSRHVNKALKAISDGYIIAIPLEHSYAFVCINGFCVCVYCWCGFVNAFAF